MSGSADTVRAPAVAGQFYPSDPDVLRRDVDRMLAEADDAGIGERIVALVAPHAGYVYSGPTAALAYRQVAGRTLDVVVVLAPSHRDSFPGVSIMARGAYETPLGRIPIHETVAQRIMDLDADVRESDLGHRAEHSLEVQLPFVQRAVGDVSIVPIVMLDRSWATCERLARAIHGATEGMQALVVASSDLYHGYSDDECDEFDARTLDSATQEDPETFCGKLERHTAQACGGGPIAVARAFADMRGASGARVLGHTTSSRVTGSSGYTVGYGAVAYYFEDDDGAMSRLAEDSRATLVDLAKQAVRAAATDADSPPVPDEPGVREAGGGAFVTLHMGGELRGCIGRMTSDDPIGETIVAMAASAAIGDPRFPPVSLDELDRVTLEISLLSPLRPVESPNDVVPGTHGVIIAGRGRRGVLLPQVAAERGWDRETFLDHTCQKAGLPASAWRSDDVEIEVFTAEIIRDDEPVGR